MREKNKVVMDLLKLASANPTLPIVAMVRNEVVDGEDYGSWAGMIVGAEIEELWTCWEYDGRTWIEIAHMVHMDEKTCRDRFNRKLLRKLAIQVCGPKADPANRRRKFILL